MHLSSDTPMKSRTPDIRNRHFVLILLFVFALSFQAMGAPIPAKRQFRGTWIHTVGQSKYAKMNQVQMKAYFNKLLDSLQTIGINAVLFQVRPEADAWYKSSLEPWSRFITGTQGKDPGWDPLAFMVEACHKRGIELHAWLNPYRARSTNAKPFSLDHIYYKHPDWFIVYGDLTWFDPGNPKCRDFIESVVKDIVKRYDIDAIHMDDYFYPYPVAGKEFDDSKSFRLYGFAMGFTQNQKAAWRRENVNMLIRDLHQIIHETKPWVQFGVSPFGIWRNKKTDPKGSNTNGLSNYDDLYADVLTWLEKGWVDYNIPQLYWEIGHKNADYTTLLNWWADNAKGKALYLGQDVLRTMKPNNSDKPQLYKKFIQSDERSEVSGQCLWPGYELENNAAGICDSLRNLYFRYPALMPANNSFDQTPPMPVRALKLQTTPEGRLKLSWVTAPYTKETDHPVRFVVYRFEVGTPVDLNDPRYILTITSSTSFELPLWCKGRQTLFVTALDRCWNESAPVVTE
jgi:uncharacterized lipoprotein YddW (UPF0748 family)